MSIVSAREKDGRRYANFGCSARHSKGSFACTNAVVVSEVMNAVFATVRDMLLNPKFAAKFLKGFDQRLTEVKNREKKDDGGKELRQFEKRVQNLADAVAVAGWSDALGEQLRVEEERLREARAAAASTAADVGLTVPPSPRRSSGSTSSGSRSSPSRRPQRARPCWRGGSGP